VAAIISTRNPWEVGLGSPLLPGSTHKRRLKMLMADAVVLGPAILGFSGVVITGILRFKPNTNGYMPKTLCDERSSAIQKDVTEIKETQIRIFDRIDDLVEGQSK